MSRKHLKPRDKVTQRMTRDGVVMENQTTGEEINISDREAERTSPPARPPAGPKRYWNGPTKCGSAAV